MVVVKSQGGIEFQSTPSVGRATRFDCKEVLKLLKFQSTPSVGRATLLPALRRKNGQISIHALRGEGDNSNITGLMSA